MESKPSGFPGNPKYRVCESPSHDRKKVVYFCDWDYIHPPTTSFLGKPIYLQFPETASLPFRSKVIAGEVYLDLLKIRPQNMYICDLGLKLLSANLALGLLLNNSKSVLQTLCLVSMNHVTREIDSTLGKKELCLQNEEFKEVFETLEAYLGQDYEIGLVGYHALNPLCEDKELDLVVISDTLEQLIIARKKIDQMEALKSIYLSEIWPLSKRTTSLGSLDFFYSTRNCPSPILTNLEQAKILKFNFEFDTIVIDDSMGILGTPVWSTENGFHLIGIDNALRGRLRIGDHITGTGISAMVGNEKVVIIQSAGNISYVVH